MTTRNFVLDKGDQLLRVSLDKLMKEENFSFVRSRIRVVRLYRYLLKERYEQFKGLSTFMPLTQSIEWLDSILEDCELLFRKYALGIISVSELDRRLNDDVVHPLYDDMASNQPGASLDDVVSDDALVLMERTWADLTSYTGAFQDSLITVFGDEKFGISSWRRKFEVEEQPVFE